MDNDEIVKKYRDMFPRRQGGISFSILEKAVVEARKDERARIFAEKLSDNAVDTIKDAVDIGIDLARPNPIVKEIVIQATTSERAKIVEMLKKLKQEKGNHTKNGYPLIYGIEEAIYEIEHYNTPSK